MATASRNTTGYLFITVSMTCDWLMVVDPAYARTLTGKITYPQQEVDFIRETSSPTPLR